MATSHTMGINISTLPVFEATNTVTAMVGGDDFGTQRFKFDVDEVNSAMRAEYTSGISLASGVEAFVNTKHRPLGQKGANKPQVLVRVQFKDQNNQIQTLTCSLGFSVENGLSAMEDVAGTKTDYVQSSTYDAQWGEFAAAVALQIALSSETTLRTALKKGLFNGVVLAGA